MVSRGDVFGPQVQALATELAGLYLSGELVVVAGAGVSRASGLPGWAEMVGTLQDAAAADLASRVTPAGLEAVLESVHKSDPISRADSLQRLLTTPIFRRHLHESLYPNTSGDPYRPSVLHWHIASLVDRKLMPDVFTSNYDDLLEDAKQSLGRSGRVRHFHGRLAQHWAGTSRLADPPVITSRDYMAAEEHRRYERFAGALKNKTVLLVGFSLSDPNLARIIRNQARDCRAILVASPSNLDPRQKALRVDLLRRYWRGLNVTVTAIEAYEELPAFFLALRREILRKQGRRLGELGERALQASIVGSPGTWPGIREWRRQLEDAVVAAKDVAGGVRGDASLRAGFYSIGADGYLVHAVSSTTRRTHASWPHRRLLADDPNPWGAAGYSFAAGVPIASSSAGAAFDRNVPDSQLLQWATQRVAQRRLPAASVLCEPAWVRYKKSLVPVGVLYFSSRRGTAFDNRSDDEELRSVLQFAFAAMIKPESAIEGGMA